MRKKVQLATMALPAIALMAISAQAQDMTYGQTEDLTPDQDPMITEPVEVLPPENSMMTEPEVGIEPPLGEDQESLRTEADEVQDTEVEPAGEWAKGENPEPDTEPLNNRTEDFADYGFEEMDTNDDGVLDQQEYVMASTAGEMTSEDRAIEIFQEAAGDDDRLTYTEFVTPQG